MLRKRSQAEKGKNAEIQRELLLQKKRKLSNGKCMVIGETVKDTDIEKTKQRQSKRTSKSKDDDYDPTKKEPRGTRSAAKRDIKTAKSAASSRGTAKPGKGGLVMGNKKPVLSEREIRAARKKEVLRRE